MNKPDIRFGAVTIDCGKSQVKPMIDFYTGLLGLKLIGPEDGPFPYLEGENFAITLQPEEGYLPPTWPDLERGQQLHLDFLVKDLPAAAAYALSLGAVESPVQFSQDWHILLDPAGHPFCLCLLPSEG